MCELSPHSFDLSIEPQIDFRHFLGFKKPPSGHPRDAANTLRGQTLLMASLQNICFQIPCFPSLPKYFLLSVEIRGHQPAWQREMALGAPNTLFHGQRHLGRKRFDRAEVTCELCMRARDDSKMCR